MKTQIKVGDIVKVNMENSPEMKVELIRNLKALCCWFDKNQQLNNNMFLLKDLIVVKESSGE